MILYNKTSSLLQESETKRGRSIGRSVTLCLGHWQEDWQCRCKQKGRQLSTLSQPLWKLYSFTRFHFTSSHCCKKWCSHANISCSLILCCENVFKGEFNFSADVYRALTTLLPSWCLISRCARCIREKSTHVWKAIFIWLFQPFLCQTLHNETINKFKRELAITYSIQN